MVKTAPERLIILKRFLFRALPQVNKELKYWQCKAAACPDLELRKQALASLKLKKFHCQGGSVFAIWPRGYQQELIRAIVALQTISDYLDNLCDRAGILEEEAFRYLHRAFTDALAPGAKVGGYYDLYPFKQDGGYLSSLVECCQRALASLPSYPKLQPEVQRLAAYYCDLQATKHVAHPQRLERLQAWLLPLLASLSAPIYWWELAAATGSTLGIFALMGLASREEIREQTISALSRAYFPWIGGLHILLDYYIDQQEDRAGGDFNFVACYSNNREAEARLHYFLEQSLQKTAALPEPAFHLTVVQGLPALYLSDAKVHMQGRAAAGQALCRAAGNFSKGLYRLCQVMRTASII
ncbi:MAG: tetraprenyl-beta-curcumene synthase family protein [Clostridia bacterium]|nr:tetraprenyl-beta-curcumene synthase family protein [Clostridia bacterium]